VASVLYALLFLPALVAIAYVLVGRRPRVLAEEVAAPSPLAELDALLAELESRTLDERTADELHALAERLERIA
jgi:hypothetical protein